MGIQVSDLPLKYRKQAEDKLRMQLIRKTSTVSTVTTPLPNAFQNAILVPQSRQNRNDHEGDEQRLLISQFEVLYPLYSSLLIHIPNGGSRKNAYEGWRLKSQGVKAGVSDLFLPVARDGHFGLWIEFKASPPYNAAVTESQQEWLLKMQGQGYRAEICMGTESAMAVLSDYLSRDPTKTC